MASAKYNILSGYLYATKATSCRLWNIELWTVKYKDKSSVTNKNSYVPESEKVYSTPAAGSAKTRQDLSSLRQEVRSMPSCLVCESR